MPRSYIYLLATKNKNGFYIKLTTNLLPSIYYARKVNADDGSLPKKPTRLVYYEEYRDKDYAQQRYRQIKRLTLLEIQRMVHSLNPHWDDLWQQVADSYHFNFFGIKYIRPSQRMKTLWEAHAAKSLPKDE